MEEPGLTIALIAGVPRSGTTLTCALLNALPGCVALAEPMQAPQHGDAALAVEQIVAFAEQTRARLLTEGVAPSKTVHGLIADNFYEEVRTDGAARRTFEVLSEVRIEKPLAPDFRLFIKHPAIFTALAGPLRQRLPLFAIVRHPLAAIASWSTVDTAFRHGRWPAAETYAPELGLRLDAIADPLDRQVALIQWMFQVYRTLPQGAVLTYEAIVADPAAALSPLSGGSLQPDHPIRDLDPATRYSGVDLKALAEALLPIQADVEPFYPAFAESLERYAGRR
jgi:hypothetical protein